MIRMFGVFSPNQIAEGAETDNIFELRARSVTMDAAIGMVYEADDSAQEDLPTQSSTA